MATYKLLVQKKYYNGHSCYTTYGIIVFEGNKHVRTIDDISTNKENIEKLVEKFNAQNLHISHLNDAIEDYLYDLRV